jgi:hypothetical protein
MKNLILFLCFSILFSCLYTGKDSNSNSVKDSKVVLDKTYIPEIEKTKLPEAGSFYIISIAGTPDIKEAVKKVKELRAKGHPASYLWIPDFPSLSKKEMYSVFIGPFTQMDSTILYLEKYKKTDPNSYAVEASKSEKRTTIFGKFDIRINDLRQFLILTYAKPKDVEEYYNNGGEDWGWFVGDVGDYFRKYYPDKVMMESVYNGWLLPKDITALEKELSLSQFGYVLINGKNKTFLEHNMPSGIIQGACEFFGIKYIEEEQGD